MSEAFNKRRYQRMRIARNAALGHIHKSRVMAFHAVYAMRQTINYSDEGAAYEKLKDANGILTKLNGRMQEAVDDAAKDQLELQAEVDRLKLYEVLERESWELRCVDVPTGGWDYDILWNVIEHHMDKPHDRIIGSGLYPIAAIRHALHCEGKE